MHRLKRSPAYKAERDRLSSAARLALWFAEDTIRGNPDNPGRTWFTLRVPNFDVDLIVVENGDLLIAFHRIAANAISLDLLIDRRSPPPWYSGD